MKSRDSLSDGETNEATRLGEFPSNGHQKSDASDLSIGDFSDSSINQAAMLDASSSVDANETTINESEAKFALSEVSSTTKAAVNETLGNGAVTRETSISETAMKDVSIDEISVNVSSIDEAEVNACLIDEDQLDDAAYNEATIVETLINEDDSDLNDESELEAIKARILEMEAEAAELRKLQSSVEEEMSLGFSNDMLSQEQLVEQQIERDKRSVYVGNVDYLASANELQEHFVISGQINTITILSDKVTGHPKGYAYVEFASENSVESALALNESLFKGRQLKVSVKRTNIHGMSAPRSYNYKHPRRYRRRPWNPY